MGTRGYNVSLFACALAVISCSGSPAQPDAPSVIPELDARVIDASSLDAVVPHDGAVDAMASDGPAIDAPDVPDHPPGTPGVGAHALSFYHLTNSTPDIDQLISLTTAPKLTAATGSTIIVSVGRGMLAAFDLPTAPPADNKGNGSYPQLDVTHKYDRWPSGTALYGLTSAHGGANHAISVATPDGDEITMAAVEVVNGTKIQDQRWNEVLSGPLKSRDVTTTGPATLIAFWWGDGFPETTPQRATPNNGFVVIDTNAQELHSFVQCAVAVKNVSAAGTYNVTWTADPVQGAQMWLVAVQ